MSMLNDPDFKLVDSVFVKLCDKPEDTLSADELKVVNIYHTLGLIENGGLHNFFCSTKMNLDELLMDYRTIKVDEASIPLEDAVSVFRQWVKKTNPVDPDPDAFREKHGRLLDKAEERYYAAGGQIVKSLADFVRSNQIGREK